MEEVQSFRGWDKQFPQLQNLEDQLVDDQSDLRPPRHSAGQVGKSLGSAANQRRSRGRGGD